MAIVVAAGINSAAAVVGAQQFNAALATMRAGIQANIRANSLLETSMGFLKTAGIALSVGYLTTKIIDSAKSIVEYGDNFAKLRARLELVGSAGSSFEGVLSSITAAAERARVPVSGMADLYRKNAVAMKEMGRNESEGIRLAESLAKVLTISGATASETAAGMTQFGQAVAAGVFQGDEFKSMVENWPEVMRILREETGKTAKQLKALGSEGAVSASIMVNSLLNASQRIDERFAKMPLTATQAWDKLVDDFQLAMGKLSDTSGVSKAWADVFSNARDLLKSDTFQSLAQSAAENVKNLAVKINEVGSASKEAATNMTAFSKAVSETEGWKNFSFYLGEIYDRFREFATLSHPRGWAQILPDPGPGDGKTGIEALDTVLERTKEIRAEMDRIAEWKTTVTKGEPVDPWKATTTKLPVAFEENSVQKAVAVERMRNELLQAEMAGEKEIELALKNQIDFRTKITKEMRDADPEAAKQLEYAIAQNNALKVQADRLREVQQLGERFASTISDGFLEAGKQGQSFIDALKGVSMKLVELIIKATILDPLIKSIGKGFGEMMPGFDGSKMFGGMLSGESVAPAVTEGWGALTSSFAMADGGVLDRPMKLMGAGAMGDVGEAGPEGVLPLRRDASGRLGVIASGSGGGNVQNITINVQGDATDATVERMRQVARNEFAAASPGLVKSSVNAVRREHSANPNYLRR